LGFGCRSISLNWTSRGLLGLYHPDRDAISAARELRRGVFSAAGPAAERRYCRLSGTPFAYDGCYSDSDRERIDRIARAANCRPSAFRAIAEALVEDRATWAAVRALAEELVGRFAEDGEAAVVPGPEAVAIMRRHGVRAGMGLPELDAGLDRASPWAAMCRGWWA
jgi:hypothetical protein